MMSLSLSGSVSPIPKPSCRLALSAPRGRTTTASAAARPAVNNTARPAAATMYDLLSVSKMAGAEEIRAAYRREARRRHPDACRTAADKGYFAEQFMRARAAYEVLSDPDLRRDYDLALLRPSDGCAAAAAFRKGGASGDRDRGFGNWERQLEGLRGRRCGAREESWGSRMRRRAGEFS